MSGPSRFPPTGIALLCMLLSTLLIASMHGSVRGLGGELHPFVIVFFRNLFGLIAVAPLILRAGVSSLKTDRPRLYIVRSAIGIVAMVLWFYALSLVPLTNATALSFSTTMFATLSAWLFLGEKMRGRRWAAIAVGLLGVLVVLRPDTTGFNRYALLILCSTMAWGVSISIAKSLSRTDSVTSIVGWMSISLTILSLPLALTVWQTPTGSQFLWLALIGALATAGHLLMTTALKMADTGVVMSVDFARLVWTALIGAWFFGEILDVWTAVGAALIFAAGLYIIFRESKLKIPSRAADKPPVG
ncbi:MAG: DMT family transporter [Gammaproteobacteria bacterium]|nr:DMT family transporter [Gammaproteobacteria bacterium]